MTQKRYIEDIIEIRQLMEKSSRFLSLSGLTGILAGIFALAGGGYGYYLIEQFHLGNLGYTDLYFRLIATALFVLIASITIGVAFTVQKAKRTGLPLWDKVAWRMATALFGPLAVGGLVILALVIRHEIIWVAPLLLVFYGLALINASKYTLIELQSMGYIQAFLGVLAMFFPGNGLIFWMIGFGFVHIIYGIYMHFKYDRK
jgi:predicted lysophospholipase L1 biosynthesis ABC-type transport system permease subunit